MQQRTFSTRFKSLDIRSVLVVDLSGLWEPKHNYAFQSVHIITCRLRAFITLAGHHSRPHRPLLHREFHKQQINFECYVNVQCCPVAIHKVYILLWTNERSLFANEQSEQWQVTSKGRSPSKLATKKQKKRQSSNTKTTEKRKKEKYIVIHKITPEKIQNN